MMNWQAMVRFLLAGALLTVAVSVRGDDPAPAPAAPPEQRSDAASAEQAEVREALKPISDAIAGATGARATVELTTRSMIDGRVISSDKTIFQLASQKPNRYRVQLKGDQQRIDVLCDGQRASVQIGTDAYYQQDAPQTLQEVVTMLPAPLGPYPEPMMALTLAGVDIAPSLLSEMQNLEVANRDPYDGHEAVQIRGTQADGVRWILWVATDAAKPRPLRMKIDLTPVLASDDEAGLPDNFTLELDYKFTLWRMDAELQKSIFAFKPPADAKQYESLEDYAAAMAVEAARHPLVGSPAPPINAKLLDGTAWELSDQKDKVIVLDFWATWCGPCIDVMPVIAEVTAAMADRDVELYAVNIGESAEQIKPFLERLDLDVKVLLDPEGKLAEAYAAEAVPQTVLIGKDGRIEAVHVGYTTLEKLKQELTDQLEVLASGGRLLTEEEVQEQD